MTVDVAHRRRTRAKIRPTRIIWHLALIVLAAFAMIPLLWMVATSLREPQTVFGGPLIPEKIVFDGYITALVEMGIWRNFLNSVLVTGLALVLIVVCSTLAGYAFARIRFRGRPLMFALIISALFVPGVATLIPIYIELKSMGLLGTHAGLILVYAAGGIPFSAFLMTTFFEALPNELAEAARIDGANEWQIFRRVMLPLAAPGVATIAIFQMLNIWNDLLLSSALVPAPALQTLQPAANRLVGEFATDYAGLTASMTLSILPMVILYIIFQKWFVRGLTAGAVK